MKLALVDFPVSCNQSYAFLPVTLWGISIFFTANALLSFPMWPAAVLFSSSDKMRIWGWVLRNQGILSLQSNFCYLQLLLSEVVRGGGQSQIKTLTKPQQDKFGFPATKPLILVNHMEDWSQQAGIVAVLCLSFQNTVKSVGVMLKDPKMRDKWSE